MATTSKSAKNGTAKRRPVFAKTYFPVQVAVFEHANDGRTNFSVKLTRSFRRDDESEWETTEYLSPQDLLPAARLLGEAYEAIQARQDEAYRERQQAGEGSDDQF
ncbi:MAG: hypothetical protein JNL18_06150 [Planctomycetaceae bacterium]|jgi:hypothetical protein|nr:hypothetical protein [Planctomycetaceae bacterium]